jgi:hypothetical protein
VARSLETVTNLLILRADARLKRCGGEVRFQLAPDSNHAKSHPAPSLIRAVARAHDWVDRILRGELTNQRTQPDRPNPQFKIATNMTDVKVSWQITTVPTPTSKFRNSSSWSVAPRRWASVL